MNEHIFNLTNHLIEHYRYDRLRRQVNEHQFLFRVKNDLEWHDVAKMGPPTLGRIICELEAGDVFLRKEEASQLLTYAGSPESFLRGFVALCLAVIIRDRLDPGATAGGLMPRFVPAARKKKK